MAKRRLFFLREENLDQIKGKGLSKNDKVIFLDESVNAKANSIGKYMVRIAKQKKQITKGYNTAWTQRWAFRKLGRGRSPAQELVFDNSSIWYFIEHLLHRTHLWDETFSEEHPIAKILLYIDTINLIINKVKPEIVYLEKTGRAFNKLVVQVCKKKGVNISILKTESKEDKKKSIKDNYLLQKKYLKARFILRNMIGKLSCKRFPKKEVIILTNTRMSNKFNKDNLFWGPIIKEMDKRKPLISYKVVEYDEITTKFYSLKKFFKRYFPKQKYDAQFIGTYYDSKTQKLSRAVVRFLSKKFRELDKRNDFKKSFEYQGINFYAFIRKMLRKIFFVYSLYIGDVYALGKAIVKKENPKVVLIDNETNFYGKAMMMQANKQKAKSVSMEGEPIAKKEKFVQESIKEILDKKSPLWKPIPDKKFVSGEFSRRWHIEKYFFPKNNLKAVGLPSYDFLQKLNKSDKRSVFKKYKIRPDEKLVLVPTFSSPMEKDFLETTINTLKGINEKMKIHVIIKQHPEFASKSTEKLFEKEMKKHSIKGTVVREGNISLLIYASSLVITFNSTIINECILLNKNTVLYEPRPDFVMTWTEKGLLKPATNLAQLKREIQSAFTRKAIFDTALRSKYVKDFFFADDGNASKRAVDEIQRMIK